MKIPAAILPSAAIGLALVALVVARGHSPADSQGDWEPALAKLEAHLKALAVRLDALDARLAETPPSSLHPSAPASKTDDGTKDQAEGVENKEEDFTGDLARLLEKGMPREDAEALIERVRKRKAQAAFLMLLEARIASHPRDAKAHYLLARALIERLMVESSYAAKEDLGNRSMAEYDKAIALDPRFWEPRFEKAESLTYYPDSMGKTPDAIREFEALLDLQGGSGHDPRYAGTYAHLGRLYLRVGKAERAEAMLREGVRLFPDNEDLRKQLELIQKK